jgi:nucleoside-diphosphate-sugar epimerase
MNILITGGTGYLGARLAFFLRKKNNIYIQSRKKKNNELKIKNIFQFQYNWKKHDILDKYLKKIDLIIHAAGVDSKFCENHKKESEKCYLNNTDILYYYAQRHNVKKIINFSTTHVYGNSNGLIDENSKIDLYNNYAKLNHGREKIIFNYDNKKINFSNLRLSNCFGYPILKQTNCWHLLIPDICKNILVNNEVNLKIKIDDYKNFTTIYDLCRFIDNLKNFKKKLPETINFSAGKPEKISSMVRRLIKIYKTKEKKKPKEEIKNLKKINFFTKNYKSKYLKKLNFQFQNNYDFEINKMMQISKKFFINE